ncbi:hypothetical protein PAQ31011_03278 [Pandoraea aquatica]|uniref:Secreted protein n=1 Tax=Pandoraea aquatica TaxID=2508290 RepID=A0A5E4WIJ4_9BURK|nr:hypothetical protein [Pandoraea aquatica]VVE23370.1 hypothetical protein PAQ31011_03278 [Pandoraea aquatica]
MSTRDRIENVMRCIKRSALAGLLFCLGAMGVSGAALAQSGAPKASGDVSILPIGPAVEAPRPDTAPGVHSYPLPTIVMRRTSDGKQCSFPAQDGAAVNFNASPYSCEDNVLSSFEVIGAHEGMIIDIEGSPRCDGSEAWASYVVSFAAGGGPTGAVATTSVVASMGVPLGTRLTDGAGNNVLIANGSRAVGEPLSTAVSCVKVTNLIPEGPYRIRNAYSGKCILNTTGPSHTAQCTDAVNQLFYVTFSQNRGVVSAAAPLDWARRESLRSIITDQYVVGVGQTTDLASVLGREESTGYLKTTTGRCASESDIPFQINTIECKYAVGATMQWTFEPVTKH